MQAFLQQVQVAMEEGSEGGEEGEREREEREIEEDISYEQLQEQLSRLEVYLTCMKILQNCESIISQTL